MAEAVIRASAEITVTTSESGVASARTIITMLVVSAASLTPFQRTVSSHEPTVTHTCPVDAFSVA